MNTIPFNASQLGTETTNQENTRRFSWQLFQRLSREPYIAIVATKEPLKEDNEFSGTVETPTKREATTTRMDDETLRQAYQGRTYADTVSPLGEYAPKVDEFSCHCNNSLTRRKYSRQPCKLCGQFPTRKETKYAEKGNKNRVTCLPLFCANETDKDGFSRTIAVRYLTRRIVFHGGNSKGKASVKTQLEGKSSSSKHAFKWYAATDIEDICQEAFLIYWEQKETGKLQGDTFRDTTRSCRTALTCFMRAREKQGKVLDAVAYKCNVDETRVRSKANKTYLDNLDVKLLNVVKREGNAKQETIAAAYKVSQPTAYRMLVKQRLALVNA